MKLTVLIIVILVGVSGLAGDGPESRVPAVSRMLGIIIPTILPGDNTASSVLRIEKVSKGFQRRGFFRIGLLPMLMVEGVELEFRNWNRVSDTLAMVADVLNSYGYGSPIEIRRVALIVSGVDALKLQAAEVRIQEDGNWLLLDVHLRTWRSDVHAPRGTLQTSGRHAGLLKLLTETDQRDFDLSLDFGPTNPPTATKPSR